MRGKAAAFMFALESLRITPAYAGKSRSITAPQLLNRDHPRICGEKADLDLGSTQSMGSPPHMRGKGGKVLRCGICPGITPAYAGKSSV